MERNALARAGSQDDPFGTALNDFVTMATELARGNRPSPEEEYLQSMSPVDAHKFAVEAQNARRYTPAEASANLKQTGMDALYVTPVIGNALSAYDAYKYGKKTAAAPDDMSRRKAAIMTELSALGAITGLPFGNAASRAAKGAASRTDIFAGPMAKTADHEALANAQRLEQAGASRDEIWSQTGWFKGTDGKWRFEIDDSGAQITGIKPPESPAHASTFDDMSHPEYEAAYGNFSPNEQPFPSYLPRETSGVFDPRAPQRGQYFPVSQSVFAQGPSEQAARGVALHEWQHHTQNLEDFARGANVEAEMRNLPVDTGNSIVEQLRKGIADGDYGEPGSASFADAYKQLRALEETVNERRARDLYRRSSGEVEARNVQTRMNMSAAERRATAPWLTQDVPDEQQIVRFGDWVMKQEQPQTFGDWMKAQGQ